MPHTRPQGFHPLDAASGTRGRHRRAAETASVARRATKTTAPTGCGSNTRGSALLPWARDNNFGSVGFEITSQPESSGFGHPLRRSDRPETVSLPESQGLLDRSSKWESHFGAFPSLADGGDGR